MDTNQAKLQAAAKLGATDQVDPSDGDPVERIVEMTSGGVHHAIECIGLKATAEQAFQMLAVGGTATVVGMVPFDEKIELHAYALLGERRLQGSSMGSNRFRVDMPRLIELYLQGRLHLDELDLAAHPPGADQRGVRGDEGRQGDPLDYRLRSRIAAPAGCICHTDRGSQDASRR